MREFLGKIISVPKRVEVSDCPHCAEAAKSRLRALTSLLEARETVRSQQKGMHRMARKIKSLRESYAALEGAYKILAEQRNK